MDFSPTFANDAECDAGRTALAAVIGAVDAEKLSWLSRLVRGPNREWRLRVMCPVHDFTRLEILRIYHEHPHLASPSQLDIRIEDHPLAEGVELLRSPQNPELEIYRRRDLIKQHEDRQAAAAEAQRKREEQSREESARLAALDAQFRSAEWHELSHAAQVLTMIAMAIESGADMASSLRDFAKVVGAGRPFPAPRKVWWERQPTR